VHEICADECIDEVKIPKLEECNEIENSDTLDTRSGQSGSDEETPTASATSLSWTCDDFSTYFYIYR
jgi:hypothetical protein